jgi:nucleotide-binding universal stress UspA family protein
VTEAQELVFRRVLVALDASAHSLAALHAAAQLAAQFGAELAGVFVEDVNLLRCAGLPFARELGSLSAAARPLDAAALERMMKSRASELQRRMASVAEQQQVRWSFSALRGQVIAELLSAARGADLLILGKATRLSGTHVRLGSTARAMMARASLTVMLVQHGAELERPVVVLFDGSLGARRALGLAARLAGEDHRNLAVLLEADSEEEYERLRQIAEAWLVRCGMEARHRRLAQTDAGALARAMIAEGGRVLVIDGAHPVLAEDALARLMNVLSVPVIAVR